MSPYEIEILLWYYSRCGDYDDIAANPPIWAPTIEKFRCEGLLTADNRTGRCYELTDKGHFYVTEGLCAVPLPVNTWRIPEKE